MFLGNGKNRLLQCYEVLLIHVIDAICSIRQLLCMNFSPKCLRHQENIEEIKVFNFDNRKCKVE